MIPRPWFWTGLLMLVLCLTAAGVIAHGQWMLRREAVAFYDETLARQAIEIELMRRELCVLWLTGDQRAGERGKAGTPAVATWSVLCSWMEGIKP